ncbi:MAG: hypothetical protein JW747_07440 [Candidatus Aminicenantes bacterium]|nr:hypothetical protein [Candidatus Aminicenantes bacterium]
MKSFLSRLVPAVAAALALALSSCIIAVVDPSAPGGMPGWGEFRQVVPFERGGTIMLENARGDIEIFGWERNEVEIVARREGRAPKPGFYWYGQYRAYELAPRVTVDVQDKTLKIRTQEDADGESGVSCLINVPLSVNIDSLRSGAGTVLLSGMYGRASVDAGKGDVQVENFSGSLDIALKKGNASAELLDLRKGDVVRIAVAEGDITVFLETGVSARIEASASQQVNSEFDLGPKTPAASVTGQIKDGLAAIVLTASQGGIELKRIKD